MANEKRNSKSQENRVIQMVEKHSNSKKKDETSQNTELLRFTEQP